MASFNPLFSARRLAFLLMVCFLAAILALRGRTGVDAGQWSVRLRPTEPDRTDQISLESQLAQNNAESNPSSKELKRKKEPKASSSSEDGQQDSRKELNITLSSHECTEGSNEFHRVCTFHDIYMFDGMLYYVVPPEGESNFTLPRIGLRFMNLDQIKSGSDWLTNATMRAVSPGELARLTANATTESLEDVVFWSTWVVPNYGHVLGEYFVSLHNTLCKYRGLCTHDPLQNIQPIDLLGIDGHEALEWPQWFHDAMLCFTTAPHLHFRAPALRGRAVHIGRALAGIGGDCRGRHLCADPEHGRGSIKPEHMAGFRARLGACLGFDPQARADTSRPTIMLVDRPYEEQRHLENVLELHNSLVEAYGGWADVKLQYMEGLTLRDQALLWSRVSVSIQMHGAVISNWLFMPINAATVHIVPRPRPDHRHNTAFAEAWEKDLGPVSNFSFVNLVNPDYSYLHLQTESLAQDPKWTKLPSKDKLAVIERGDCSGVPLQYRAHQCGRVWLLLSVNLVVQPRLLRAAVDQALLQLYNKTGEGLPEGFAPSEPTPEDQAALGV